MCLAIVLACSILLPVRSSEAQVCVCVCVCVCARARYMKSLPFIHIHVAACNTLQTPCNIMPSDLHSLAFTHRKMHATACFDTLSFIKPCTQELSMRRLQTKAARGSRHGFTKGANQSACLLPSPQSRNKAAWRSLFPDPIDAHILAHSFLHAIAGSPTVRVIMSEAARLPKFVGWCDAACHRGARECRRLGGGGGRIR